MNGGLERENHACVERRVLEAVKYLRLTVEIWFSIFPDEAIINWNG